MQSANLCRLKYNLFVTRLLVSFDKLESNYKQILSEKRQGKKERKKEIKDERNK